MKGIPRILPAATLAGLALLLQACSPASPGNSVAAAYETSGVVNVQPYTRTIFSTHNF